MRKNSGGHSDDYKDISFVLRELTESIKDGCTDCMGVAGKIDVLNGIANVKIIHFNKENSDELLQMAFGYDVKLAKNINKARVTELELGGKKTRFMASTIKEESAEDGSVTCDSDNSENDTGSIRTVWTLRILEQ